MSSFNRPSSSTLASLLAVCLLVAPAPSLSESSMASQTRGASASLDFRIVIPPVIQLLENSHPTRLDPIDGGAWSAQQRLVVVSNMKRGFCVSMRMDAPQVDAWRVQAAQQGGVTLTEVADGYRLCTARSGRYTLLIQHEFQASSREAPKAMVWPVHTDLTAL